jgi:hypothetical protein
MSPIVNLGIIGALVGGAYYFGAYLPEKRRKEKKKGTVTPTPTPGPGPEVFNYRTPPNPQQVLEAHTEHDVNTMIQALQGVPTAVLVVFSKGATYQKVAPLFRGLAEAYPEVQFVESDLQNMMGTSADVVAFDVGLDLGSSSLHTGGMTLLMTDGPETAKQKLEAAGEASEPLWPEANSDTRDMVTAQADMFDALDTLVDRLGKIPQPKVA